jgi:hypothetical protein
MMKESDKKFLATWEETRKKGLLHYILINGVIWGAVVFLFATLFDLTEKSFAEAYLSLKALGKFASFLVAGVFFYSPTMWWYYNWRYKSLKERKNEISGN